MEPTTSTTADRPSGDHQSTHYSDSFYHHERILQSQMDTNMQLMRQLAYISQQVSQLHCISPNPVSDPARIPLPADRLPSRQTPTTEPPASMPEPEIKKCRGFLNQCFLIFNQRPFFSL